MESLAVTLLPPEVSVLAALGLVALSLATSALMRQHIDGRILLPFVLGSVLGIVLGAKLFVALPTPVLQAILGLFILTVVWLPKLKASHIPNPGFTLVGIVGSFSTMFVGATGPFVASFITPDRLPRHAVVATHATCMTVQHTLKVAAFGFLGFAFLPWAPLLATMIGAGFLGTMLGRRMLDRLPHRVFAHAFKVILTVLALRLLYAAASAW